MSYQEQRVNFRYFCSYLNIVCDVLNYLSSGKEFMLFMLSADFSQSIVLKNSSRNATGVSNRLGQDQA